jgi:glycerol uptake facilitator-like aquaporin|tara:strand:- start:563 stop:802 length:240 start_codon:yes stop_codon:yes gene_type:complete
MDTCVIKDSNGDCTKRSFDYNGCKVIDNVGLLLGMFVTIMFSARISGSHFNPCITFSYMIGNVKQGKFDRILGLLYIAA